MAKIKMYVCDICNKEYKSKKLIIRGIRSAKFGIKKVDICRECCFSLKVQHIEKEDVIKTLQSVLDKIDLSYDGNNKLMDYVEAEINKRRVHWRPPMADFYTNCLKKVEG